MSNVARNAPANSPLARSCVICGKPSPRSGRALYCSPACRLRAFRLRHLQDRELLRLEAAHVLRRRAGILSHSVYECPRCEERYLGVRRCPECNLMCRRLGLGGECPHCDELVLVADLVPEVEL